jgi:phospholipid/cholesterol/gamma-HCH transport system permease protein
VINLEDVSLFDTAAAIFIQNLQKNSPSCTLVIVDKKIEKTLELVKNQSIKFIVNDNKNENLLQSIGKKVYDIFIYFLQFMDFFGKVFFSGFTYISNIKNIRYREIAFEINESAIKALGIVALTSFLIGVVVAYQSAYQLKIYGANIFIVDMLGISILRELAPLITAIVIAGRSGSAFTAQIGAMKITQELDAMQTMGFNPYAFLVMPRIIALMIALPILIFVADVMGVLGGMMVSYIDLGITSNLFLERFSEVVAVKHFFIGMLKGPFFAFLIASIGIFRGLQVKDNTQSIGFNTTKSVVESIFAVIVCDAVFSVALTTLGI